MADITILQLLTYENSVLRNYCFWSALLVIKILLMAILTAVQRIRKKAFANPEDVKKLKNIDVIFDDPHVERVRRAHRNDMENIFPYLIVSFIYVLTNPTPVVAVNLFRIVFGCRVFHTIVYAIFVLPQPARALAFFIPYGITFYMAIQSTITFVN